MFKTAQSVYETDDKRMRTDAKIGSFLSVIRLFIDTIYRGDKYIMPCQFFYSMWYCILFLLNIDTWRCRVAFKLESNKTCIASEIKIKSSSCDQGSFRKYIIYKLFSHPVNVKT